VPLEIGEQVGLYRVVELLGEGGTAAVFKAHHSVLDRHVALKILHPTFLEDSDFLRRFQREARVVAGFDHPNIVPLFDFAEHRGMPYLVMKFIQGETLKTRLARGPVSSQQTLQIVGAVGEALSYAHERGVLHRDIKPSNVLLGEEGSVFLSDFGLARIVSEGESTLSREMTMGTAEYISPEQIRAEPDLDERTDIYSFGVLIYELVAGHVPFHADNPVSTIRHHLDSDPPSLSEQDPGVPKTVERVVLKAMAKEREGRFRSVKEMVSAFRIAAEEERMGTTPSLAPAETIAFPEHDRPQAGELEGLLTLVSANGNRFPLAGERLLVGRADPKKGFSPDIDLTQAEPLYPRTGKRRRTVHREQAWIFRSQGGWWVEIIPGKEDRAQLNGKSMTGGRRYELRAGDKLTLGAVDLEAQQGLLTPEYRSLP